MREFWSSDDPYAPPKGGWMPLTRKCAKRPEASSTSASAGEVVQRPIEGDVFHGEIVLPEGLTFGRQELWADEGKRRPLDRTPCAEGLAGLVAVRGNEVLFAPRKNRADPQLVLRAIDLRALCPVHALICDIGELRLQLLRRECLAAK